MQHALIILVLFSVGAHADFASDRGCYGDTTSCGDVSDRGCYGDIIACGKPFSTPEPTSQPGIAAVTSDVTTADFIISSCDTEGLILQSIIPDAQLPVVGDLLWNVAASRNHEDACDSCGQWGAVITSVDKPAQCESGEQGCVEVLVTFRDATLEEVFEDDLLDALNVQDAAATTTFSDLLECNGSEPASSRLLLSGGLSPHPGRALLQAFARPGSCDEWTSVGGDGRCAYSNCFVGNDPIPLNPNCFGCEANECNNGCGSSFIDAPETEPGVFDFTDACCSHDHCYSSTSFDRAMCDDGFYADMLSNCEAIHGDLDAVIITSGQERLVARRGAQTPMQQAFVDRRNCMSQAYKYFLAVNIFGGFFFETAQSSAQAWEEGPNCIAQCPSTQEAGGQGTTVLRIDMLTISGTFPLSYQMYQIPDQLDITYEGGSIFSTGGLVSGFQSTTATFNGTSTIIEATITAPNDGTAWDVFIGCTQSP